MEGDAARHPDLGFVVVVVVVVVLLVIFVVAVVVESVAFLVELLR